jgi:hypothetical protein
MKTPPAARDRGGERGFTGGPMSERVDLNAMKPGYDGRLKRAEISAHEPPIHDVPGVYLQFVEGCGYDVYELTPDEADAISKYLADAAVQTRAAFSEQANGADPAR